MKQDLWLPLLVAGQKGDQTAGDEASPVRPIVDSREKEPEEDKAHHPSHRLAVDLLPIEASPALAIVEDGPDETAEGSGGADGEGNAGQLGEKKAGDAGPDVKNREAVEAEFAQDEWGELPEGHHVEEDV